MPYELYFIVLKNVGINLVGEERGVDMEALDMGMNMIKRYYVRFSKN